MSSTSAAPAPIQQPPLSQVERITNMFFAPSKTFKDLNRDNSWWAAWLLIAAFSFLFMFSVQQKVGFEQITKNEIAASPKAQERMEKLTPEARENAMQLQSKIGKTFSYAFPVLLLISAAVVGGALLAAFNFGLGTELKFNTVLAVVFYGWIPGVLKSVLVAISLFAGADPEGFNVNNPVATNLGYFISRTDHPILSGALSWIDIFAIWYIVLFGIGFSCVTKVKRGTATSLVAGLYVVAALIGIGFRALTT